ncbi:hypothetical protein GGE50_003820 [Rhizobium leguminosarum]|uniref:hypothetical protein n=1 Tax=Rhizobium leguminosarum TaxID=384 RepID=UPI0016116DB7|nr:hypothetical protein [Rhizobium leguminosarum]MBB4587916.1 hypothetical protein [Rhizobium leguminosarum]
MPLLLIAAGPAFVIVTASLLMARLGARISAAIIVSSLAVGGLLLWQVAIAPTCAIAESECIGVKGLAYVVIFFWFLSTAAFLLTLYKHLRSACAR